MRRALLISLAVHGVIALMWWLIPDGRPRTSALPPAPAVMTRFPLRLMPKAVAAPVNEEPVKVVAKKAAPAALPTQTPVAIEPPTSDQRVSASDAVPPSQPEGVAVVGDAGAVLETAPGTGLGSLVPAKSGSFAAALGEGTGAATGLAELHARLKASALRCYPKSARRFRQTGVAQVHFCIDTVSVASQQEVRGTSGIESLDDAALGCVVPGSAPWPAEVVGQCFTVPVRFGAP